MGRTRTAIRPTRHPLRIALVGLAAAALLFAACGGDDDDDASSDSTTGTTGGSGELTDVGHGVSADTIKVGIAIIDYDAIKDFVDFTRGDQQETAQVFVDDINKNGGIDGRQIEPVYKKYPPIPGQQPDPLSLCTSWTEDDEVFAVLGVFIDFSGDGLALPHARSTTRSTSVTSSSSRGSTSRRPGLMLTPDTHEGSAAQGPDQPARRAG